MPPAPPNMCLALYLYVKLFDRKPTPGTEFCSPVPQCIDSANAPHSESCQQTDTPPDPKVSEQRPSEEDGTGRQRGSEEVVAGEQTGGVMWIR